MKGKHKQHPETVQNNSDRVLMNKQREYYAISHSDNARGNKRGDTESIRPRLRLLGIIKKGLYANTLNSENYCDPTSVHLPS